MDDDFVDVFRGGVGDSPVKTSCAPDHDLGSTSSWRSGPPISLSIPGIETGGGAAPVSPAIPSHGIAMPSPPAKEGVLFSARTFTNLRDDDYASQHTGQLQLSPVSSPHPRFGLTPILTIDPGGECIPTELEKKRAKLERYRYICSEVSESFLYVAGEDAAKQEGLVRQVGVTHIINCAGPQCPNYLEYVWMFSPDEVIWSLGAPVIMSPLWEADTGRFNFLRLNFYDHHTEDIAWFIYSAFDFISAAKAKKGRVLIHCVQGVSRSCTLAIAWLMLTANMDYDQAYLRVRQGRPICAPNAGFICGLLEWQRRREKSLSAPLLYRTAWHVPHFPTEVILKLCLHEEDRKHVAPTLDAFDPRGCYLLVAPRLEEPATDFVAASGFQSGQRALGGVGNRGRESVGEGRTGIENLVVSPISSRNGTARANGSIGSYFSSASKASAQPPPLSIPTVNVPTPAIQAQPGGSASPAARSESSASGASAASTLRGSSTATAAVAAGEAARTAQALEVGIAIAAALREKPSAGCCGRDASKGSARVGSVRKSAAESRAASVAPEGVVAAGVEVYVWRGSESHSRMFELAKDGARWLLEYEGWGQGVNAPVVEEGQEPPEMLRHLGLPGSHARKSPVYGDLTAPSPPPTAAWENASSMFNLHVTTPSGHAIMTPRAPPLPSPAEPPMLSPAGPSPSPGGLVGFSPYGQGVSPAGGLASSCGGLGSCVGSAIGSYGNGGSVLGLGPTLSPAGSAVASPATSRLYVMSDCAPISRRCSLASANEDVEVNEDDGYLLMGISGLEPEEQNDEDFTGDSGAAEDEADHPLEPLLSSESRNQVEGQSGMSGFGNRPPAPAAASPASLPTALPARARGGFACAELEARRRAAPRLFELSDEPPEGRNYAGNRSAGILHWSELAIFDDEDLAPQCCFLLVLSHGKTYLWIGEEFGEAVAAQAQGDQRLRQVQSLAREAAFCYTAADGAFPGPRGVESAVIVSGSQETEEWWEAFESGYT